MLILVFRHPNRTLYRRRRGTCASLPILHLTHAWLTQTPSRKEGKVWVLALSVVAVFFCSSIQAAGSLTDWWYQILGKGGAKDVNDTLAIIEGLVDTSFHISVSNQRSARCKTRYSFTIVPPWRCPRRVARVGHMARQLHCAWPARYVHGLDRRRVNALRGRLFC